MLLYIDLILIKLDDSDADLAVFSWDQYT